MMKNDQACKAAAKIFFSIQKTNATNLSPENSRDETHFKNCKAKYTTIVPDKTMPVAPHCPPIKCEMTRYAK